MLSFKEWCNIRFGIINMGEGKIVKKTFFPLHDNPVFNDPQKLSQIAKLLGPLILQDGSPGYVLSPYASQQLFQCNTEINSGYDAETPAPFYLVIKAERQKEFLWQFAEFSPFLTSNPLIGAESIYIPSALLDVLYQQYFHETVRDESLADSHSRLMTFKLIEKNFDKKNKTVDSLNHIHYLALDNTNDEKVKCNVLEAISAYSLSLQLFAETHKHFLLKEQYVSLLYAMNLLISRNPSQHTLLREVLFIENLRKVVGHFDKPDKSSPLISELNNGSAIKKLIEQNARFLLHGNLAIGDKISTNRFLPDSRMHSETNEIILRTGGMFHHFNVARIIKVGMLRDGRKTNFDEKPDYFNYYKVEMNLGANCYEPDNIAKTCMGTYVTQLEPIRFTSNGIIERFPVDPLQQPDLYQLHMEQTLLELIKAEREIGCYRPPCSLHGDVNLSSPIHSMEAAEWKRLRALLDLLNGKPVNTPFVYDAFRYEGKVVSREVFNQKGYMQDEGSCLAFSLKQLITSITGYELASLHNHFLQTHDGVFHEQVVQNEIAYIEVELKKAAEAISDDYLAFLRGRHREKDVFPQHLFDFLFNYPDLYQRCLTETKGLIKTYLNQLLSIKPAISREEFNSFYKTLPLSFQQHFITAYAKVNKLCTMPVHKQGDGKNYSPFFFNEPVILYQALGVRSREGAREVSFFQI